MEKILIKEQGKKRLVRDFFFTSCLKLFWASIFFVTTKKSPQEFHRCPFQSYLVLVIFYQGSKDLQDRIGRWFLRRTKALIADQLPKKGKVRERVYLGHVAGWEVATFTRVNNFAFLSGGKRRWLIG